MNMDKGIFTKKIHLFQRNPANPILDASMWPYKVNSVFNPGAVEVKGEVLLLVRVEDLKGISHFSTARSKNGVSDWEIDSYPAMVPEPEIHPEEVWGIEDPRIVWIEEKQSWFISYTAYSRGGPLVSLAETKDFKFFKRLGPVMPPEDKDAALFPKRFGGRWAMLHRPVTTYLQGRGHIWLSFSPDMKHWGDHQIILEAREGAWWDAYKIGLGPPPMETQEGWLILYHGVKQTASGSIYRLGLALLDLDDPRKVIKRGDAWVFGPEEPYERIGDVGNVVFSCGWVYDKNDDTIKIYYGAADTSICLAEARLKELLDYLLR